jgi:UTP--glucose-1-phosphate uridylyltransferase
MRPLTYACPKELLPVGAKPVIHRLIEELANAGITEACIVSSPEKPALERYLREIDSPVTLTFAYQEAPKGLGDAILYSREFAAGESVVIALGDCLIHSKEAAFPLQRMLQRNESAETGCILGEVVPKERISKYGVMDPAPRSMEKEAEFFPLQGLKEKPPVDQAPSDIAVSARYLLPNSVYDALERSPYGAKGELVLTDALILMIAEGVRLSGLKLRPGERRLDIGGFSTYFNAFETYAAQDRLMMKEGNS